MQSDVKSSLAYAALTQVGIIVVEIALGWYFIAFVPFIGGIWLLVLTLMEGTPGPNRFG